MKNIIQKYALLIGGLLLLFILFFQYLKSFFNSKKFGFDDYSNSLDENGATIDDSKAYRLADILHVSMASIGTDFESIKIALSGLSPSDYAKVYNRFGTRGYIDIVGVGTNLPTATKLNLTQWFQSELTNYEILELKRLYPLIF
ncbi:hypothetical protein P8625_02935 [Tenacibaculum tangerinum]|uniref:Uncharacterized protein n=1 Tax=Tenacibaculum tangerinum TaxID=3038772 RepID=A0ABY8L7Q8_9FLAO|nr:hypothetical protein [Tenacibaculum tangerinum]WGH76139.1 hypothetical protein P8625_02935 [Tenacibaculum tangerinum]